MNDMDKTLVIVHAIRRDGLDIKTYDFAYLTPSFFCKKGPEGEKEYLKKAVGAWLSTEDGLKAFEDTSEDFNWLDVRHYVPDIWLAGYNIFPVKSGINVTFGRPACMIIEVDADEVFEPDAMRNN